jgi:hypothetical protein
MVESTNPVDQTGSGPHPMKRRVKGDRADGVTTCCDFTGAMGDSWRWMREEEDGAMKAPAVERPASARTAVNLMVVAFV